MNTTTQNAERNDTLDDINARLEEISAFLSEASAVANMVGQSIDARQVKGVGAVYGVERIISCAKDKTEALIQDVMAANR